MNKYEVIVVDGAGFTYTFVYEARSETDARAQFRRKANRQGITNFKNIKILEVNKVS
jgi:hypothetical protein